MSTRVVIAENDPELRLMFRAHVQTIPGFEVVGHAPDENRAVSLCDELNPEIVVISVHDDRSVEAPIARVRANCPDVKVMVVTSPGASGVRPGGADAVLSRPLGSESFVSSLAELAGAGA